MTKKCAACPCPSICLAKFAYCEWMRAEEPDPVHVKAIIAGSQRAASGPQYPPVATQVGNALAAAGRVVAAVATGQEVLVSPEEDARRGAICESNVCGKYDATQARCTLCGCQTKRKRALATEKCPDDPSRW